MAVINPTDWQYTAIYCCESCSKVLTEAQAYQGPDGIQCEDCFVKSQACQHLAHMQYDNDSVADLYL